MNIAAQKKDLRVLEKQLSDVETQLSDVETQEYDAFIKYNKLTEEAFKEKVQNKFVVLINGKGNLPSDETNPYNNNNYSHFKKNFPDEIDRTFLAQLSAFKDLDANWNKDFKYFYSGLLEYVTTNHIGQDIVFIFKGDNLQDNSPFTKGIAYLLKTYEHEVYAIHSEQPNKKHFLSWWETPYTNFVVLDSSLSDYTKQKCDLVFSYGMPLIRFDQPQMDDEWKIDTNGAFGDIHKRKMVRKCTPGLVIPTLASEMEKLNRNEDFRELFFNTELAKRGLLWIKKKHK